MNKIKLPKGWKYKRLGDMFTFVGGGTPGKAQLDYWNGSLNWASVKDVKGDFLNSTKDFITEKGLKNSASNLAEKGDVILITRISPGKSIITNIRTAINQDLKIAKPKFKTTPKFIYYFFSAIERDCIKKSSGTTVLGITLNNLNELLIPDLSLEEQSSIVSKIEELFSELDKGIEDLKTAQLQLKTYRQAVLKYAFEGKLTNEKVKDGVLPKGWGIVKIADVALTYGGYAFKSGEFKSQGKYQVLRMGNVRPGIVRYDENPVYFDEVDQSILNRSLLKINDVIITQTGTRKKRDYGFTTLISKDNLLLNQRIASIRFGDKYSPKFFLYYSWTDLFKDQFFANETGNVGQGNVGMKAVTETLIPNPSYEEQHQIVQEIESRLSVADKMEESITQSLQQAEALRQSILKKAFSGESV